MDIILKERHGVSFFTCSDTRWQGAAHGFSTRLGGVSPAPWDSLNLGASRGDCPDNVRENFARFCAAVGTDPGAIVQNHQVHGRFVRPVSRTDTEAPSIPSMVDADGLITDEPRLCLTVFSADCIPVLLYDPVRRVISAVHAGWRGTAQGIAAQAVQAMVQDYNCAPDHILAAIGPGISQCCFETREDVPQALLASLGPQAEPLIRPLSQAGKYKVDLKGANAQWLYTAGLTPDHIAVCPACTACRPDLFWSHRKLSQTRGSMAAMIQLLP